MTINFPPRPNENSDPWYAARETYDRGLENAINSLENSKMEGTRGVLPNGTDVDDLYSSSDVGTWRVVDTYTYQNLPEELGNPALFHVAESARSVFQFHIGVGFFCWRFRSANVWGAWYDVVSHTSLDGVVSTLEDSKMEVTRGALPDGTDVNDLHSTSDVGTWRAVDTRTYRNLPEVPVNPAILHVAESARSVFQMYIGNGYFWWRFRSANVWDRWRKVASQDSVDTKLADHEDRLTALEGLIGT